ncbi:hypothetical protein C4577_04480 [Candidatus Parcubacteria bacterium]|nr:MAG: hypothetical protein C4577_04480 [Candidatus Parcubacteria bacterium]
MGLLDRLKEICEQKLARQAEKEGAEEGVPTRAQKASAEAMNREAEKRKRIFGDGEGGIEG